MQKFTFATKSYCLLTKPGIMIGNVITTAGGFALASRGRIDVWLFLATLLGICLVIASGCVFNNYIDRDADQKMERTKNRALAKGVISTHSAIVFAIVLGVLGTLCLAFFTNLLATAIALVGFLVYVVLYSFSKYYSIHGTLVGSVAGAIPPVVGYTAVSNRLDLGAFILFAIIVVWQMPHFYAIAIYRLKEYTAAAIPVVPIKKGMKATKIQMLLYIIAFIAVSLMLVVFGYVGALYLLTALVLGLAWLGLCIQGFYAKNDRLWARKMFIFSLVVIMGISIAIPFSVL
jgi:protoheme IX farnesyltransferase